ncbi:adenylate kinase family protein [Blattabacterium cuenoti]|uniref:adenylate kinase family protein n=1 Tax=Blattabacterium cuenoti TaxID=1653831 RepID=UPI00163C315E|nr:nucleoside monophosphate kinase [Blattabacterium cuenoti]
MIHIILFGPPGCGKGTQAKIIVKKFGFIHLSTGIIFRNHIKNKTNLGDLSSFYIRKGVLVPDKITTNMLKIEIEKHINAKGIVYDGYPRTKNQIIFLEKILEQFDLGKIDQIFYFYIKKDMIINRLLKRGETSNRNDDVNIITIKRRIKEYEKETSLIWNSSKWNNNILTKINGSLSINEISHVIGKKIKEIS